MLTRIARRSKYGVAWWGKARPDENAMYDGQARLARTVPLRETNKARRGNDGHTGNANDGRTKMVRLVGMTTQCGTV